ncbi:MAG: ABC transporter permease [Phaeodactylibacter sp.]|uniref:ABC transporter permease n=1 Tax=Phaeodactylibacter sp. TaxID=1940289 RepID=UPI0032ED2A1B
MMDNPVPIPLWAMVAFYALLLLPAGLIWYFRLGVLRRLAIAVVRMTVQLTLVGVLLIYWFRWDNAWLNVLWVVVMVGFAAVSAVQSSTLRLRYFFVPVFLALLVSGLSVLLFFNVLLLPIREVFSAQYLIIIGGMLLGNALKGIVIGLSDFYQRLQDQQDAYRYYLAAGASRWEALIPFFRNSLQAALNPSIASMATMGVVFLPGMMTGQIIGGATPDTAIRYQLAIMIVIFVCIALSVVLGVSFSLGRSFDGYGNLRAGVFRK